MTLSMADMSAGKPRESRKKSARSEGPRSGQPIRRVFTEAYKNTIIDEYYSLTERGARGALLRREGLFESTVSKWRRARERGALAATPARGGAESSTESAETRRLRRENERLTEELAKTRAVLEVVGKAHALLEMLSESAD